MIASHLKKDREVPSLVGAHPSARVVERIKARAVDKFPRLDVALNQFLDQNIVKNISEENILTRIDVNSRFEKTLEYKLVDIGQDVSLENFSENSVKTSHTIAAALMRKIHYNTFRLILD